MRPSFAVLLLIGCSWQGPEGAPPEGAPSTSIDANEPCSEGTTRVCHETLSQHGVVALCLEGEETCNAGWWSDCEGAYTYTQRIRGGSAPSRSPQSLSEPTACENNPCDPSCQAFLEAPTSGIQASPSVAATYDIGSVASIPPGFFGNGINEPCGTAQDCQFDQFCENPVSGSCSHDKCATGDALVSGCDDCVTSICATKPECCVASGGSCSHDKCLSGEALVSGCDPCVSVVCAADSTCCTTAYGGSCTHDPCSEGASLGTSCDSCVEDICDVDPYCCASYGSWDSICVGEVLSICGNDCSSSSWTSSCVDLVGSLCGFTCVGPQWDDDCVAEVGSTCGAFCANGISCSHDKCVTGTKLTASCDECVADICAVDSYCCTVSWDSVCTSEVASVCGEACDSVGNCASWDLGDTSPYCTGVDLTVAIPCSDTVTVCNRGSMAADAGVVVYAYSGNEARFGQCDPDIASPPVLGSCTVPTAIEPGYCVNLHESDCNSSDGTSLLEGNLTLMVNPPIAGAVSECRCDNNWGDYHAGSCTSMSLYHYEAFTYSDMYTAECPSGTKVQWGYLAYDASIPNDASITFEVRTADSEPELSSASFVTLTTAGASEELCSMTGPSPCPLDLYAALAGAPEAHRDVLELTIVETPTIDEKNTPILNTWTITYSCVDSE